jgi:hypothetical protein
MSNGTITKAGRFTSTGTAKTITLRGDIDWMEVWNATVLDAAGAGTGAKFEWQRGMTDDTGIEYKKTAATNALQIDMLTSGGFTRIDTSGSPLTAINTTGTAISNAAIPIASCTSTAGLVDGDTVRLIDPTGAQQFGGIDFTIDTVVANTSFRLVYAPQIVAGTSFSFYKVKWEPLFAPKTRYISSITAPGDGTALVETTVTHGYTVGQKVRFNVPSAFGMIEMDQLVGEITNVTTATNTFNVDIDPSTFTAFAWPLTAGVPFTPATVVPVGDGTAQLTAGTFEGAKDNIGKIAMVLAAGTDSPAGILNDVIYWRAGKVLDVNNE